MMSLYADVIVGRSIEALDRSFEYRIPESLADRIQPGTPVKVPFGRGDKPITGYVTGIRTHASWQADKLKEILAVDESGVSADGQLLSLAGWMAGYYGSTMNEAIRTVLPVRTRVKSVEEHWLTFVISRDEAAKIAEEEEKKHHVARARLIRGMLERDEPLSGREAASLYKATADVINGLKKRGVLEVETRKKNRNPGELSVFADDESAPELNEEQRQVADIFRKDYREDRRGVYLLYGVTGSGKTEVYLSMVEEVLKEGKQVIVLIPEIALSHQTVQRFMKRLGSRVAVIHSRMSAGERYDQFDRVRNHEADVVVGPRSAVFAPFDKLGLIIVDEEHESSYHSSKTPGYHAREVAIRRARMSDASVVLGSATPSVGSFQEAREGRYTLLRLRHRATGASLPEVHVVDLREELRAGNRSVFSRLLQEKIHERLNRGEQTMLFLNRRGYAGFVSCRSCGFVLKCTHCDVSMTAHRFGKNKNRLICHYCGDETEMPDKCPACGSTYIAAFGLGTEKVAELVAAEFKGARVLRMDADTTKNKGGHERVLAPFREGEADILVGTQMIVKGHDFPRVTLVGAIAADLSMFSGDYLSNERTYQLLMQAGGRAGRGSKKGEFVIQTYQPDAYCIQAVLSGDEDTFYETELAYRRMGGYPPFFRMLHILVSGVDKTVTQELAGRLACHIRECGYEGITVIGPASDVIEKMQDKYRFLLHIRSETEETMELVMAVISRTSKEDRAAGRCMIQYNRE